MHVKIEKGAAWLGLAMLGGFFVMFLVIARLVPPMDPGDSAAEIAKIYSEHGLRIRVGLALMTLFAVFFTPYFALLSRQVRRLTGLHLFHVLIGLVVLILLLTQARRTELSPTRMALVEGGACFWHLVDLLWIVLFPLLYLVS